MARNRRRSRTPRQGSSAGAGSNGTVQNGAGGLEPDALPEALQHANPDAELAEAQLALGRPDLADVPDSEQLEEFEEEQAGRGGRRGGAGGIGGGGGGPGGGGPGGGGVGGAGGPRGARAGAPESLPRRAVGFLRGCWLELQRVQWPDRRQVFQATGVVLGFVIVAGAFLGLADLVASKLVNLILTGHA